MAVEGTEEMASPEKQARITWAFQATVQTSTFLPRRMRICWRTWGRGVKEVSLLLLGNPTVEPVSRLVFPQDPPHQGIAPRFHHQHPLRSVSARPDCSSLELLDSQPPGGRAVSVRHALPSPVLPSESHFPEPHGFTKTLAASQENQLLQPLAFAPGE